MNILDEIVEAKRREVARKKAETPLDYLQREGAFFDAPCRSMKQFLTDPAKTGIIAEFKRRSPSKGVINNAVSVEEVTKAYEEAGASGLSVLTDTDYFGGSSEDLKAARRTVSLPVLRKDFMVDLYQVTEAKAMGADVILLIAACLEPSEVKVLAEEAKRLGMEVLLEVHNAGELENNLHEAIDIVGVNNRNLKDFSVDINTSLDLASRIPSGMVKISESGLYDVQNILTLREAGYQGFLIGESFMKQEDPGAAIKSFVKALNRKAVQ